MQQVEPSSSAWLQRSPFHEALVELAQLEETDAARFVAHVLEVDATILHVARVSYWTFDESHSCIHCEDLFVAGQQKHARGQELSASRYPRYFAALIDARTIAADHAQTDPRTSEFCDHYLRPEGITSLLDVPIRRHGELVGILCHEHVANDRHWTREEQDFAAAIADAVALGLDAAERNKLLAALREREHHLGLIGRRVPAVLWTTDDKLVVTWASGAALGPIGLRPEVLAGTSVVDWLTMSDNTDELTNLHRRAIAGEACSAVVQRNGHHLELRVEPFRDDDDAVVGAIGIAIDVTRRTQAEQARDRILRDEQRAHERAERLREQAHFITRATQAFAHTLDEDACLAAIALQCCPTLADYCVIALNDLDDGGARLIGPSPQTLRPQGSRTEYRLDPDAPDGLAQVLRTKRPVVHPIVTADMLFASGEQWPIVGTREPKALIELQRMGVRSYLAVPMLLEEQLIGGIALFRRADDHPFDATDVEVATQLAAQAAGAIDRSRMHRKAIDAVKVRDEFLSFAAHELYTPLTALELALASLRRSFSRGTPSSDRQLTLAVEQGRRLARLVSELLDTTRIRAGVLSLRTEPVDLATLVRETIASYPSRMHGRDVKISVATEPVTGEWDRFRIEQVITNLVGNAVKYGAGRPVEVSVTRTATEAIFSVRDRGIGIPAGRLSHVFEPFERAVPTAGYTGLGLGLFIVQRIVEGHAGTINIESEEGRGTTVTVTLPLAPPDTPSSVSTRSE